MSNHAAQETYCMNDGQGACDGMRFGLLLSNLLALLRFGFGASLQKSLTYCGKMKHVTCTGLSSQKALLRIITRQSWYMH